MVKLVISDASYLKDSVSVLSELVNEARFKMTKDGLELVAMDPANVAMVIFKLLSSSFTEYDVQQEQSLAINLQNFKQVLKRASPSDVLTLETGPDNKLTIQLKGATTRTFSLPIIDLEDKEQRVPNLSFPVTVSTPSAMLNDAISDVDIIAESVSLAAEPEHFSIAAEGDLSKAHIEIKSSDDTHIRSDTKAKVKAKYSIEYLKKMIQAAKLSDRVDIHFNQDYPLRLDYKVIDKLSMSFILAPRVEND